MLEENILQKMKNYTHGGHIGIKLEKSNRGRG